MLIPQLRSRFLFPLAEKMSGRNVNSRLAWLHETFNEHWAQRKHANTVRLVEVLQNAKYEIPFYRDMFQKVRFDPLRVLKDVRYFEKLPVLTKEDIREAGERLLHPSCRKYLSVHVSKTNGSTGSALPIYYTPAAKDYSAAVTRLSQEWVGFGADKLQLHISSAFPGETPKVAKRQEWWRQQATNRIGVECSDWSPESLTALWNQIRDARAYLVQGHPSTMYALARHVTDSVGKQPGAFAVFVSTGETLTLQQRETIESAFACRVANRYGNAEFGIVAHERFVSHDTGGIATDEVLTAASAAESRFMQVMDPYVWVESLSGGADSSGSLVVTDLTNFSSPLIRYATGDEGTLRAGRDGLYLETVSGRVHDQIVVSQRAYPTHWFQDFFTRLGIVDDFQFVRAEGALLELRICLLKGASEAAVRSTLAESFPDEPFNTTFVERGEFVRVGQQQKFRYLVDLKAPPGVAAASPQSAPPLFSGKNDARTFLYRNGWNDEEVYPSGSFRWMGRRAEIVLNPHKPLKRLTLAFDYPSDAKKFPTLSVRENGKVLETFFVTGGPQSISVALPESTQTGPRIVVLDVNALYPVPGDHRELGLKVHGIDFQ